MFFHNLKISIILLNAKVDLYFIEKGADLRGADIIVLGILTCNISQSLKFLFSLCLHSNSNQNDFEALDRDNFAN